MVSLVVATVSAAAAVWNVATSTVSAVCDVRSSRSHMCAGDVIAAREKFSDMSVIYTELLVDSTIGLRIATVGIPTSQDLSASMRHGAKLSDVVAELMGSSKYMRIWSTGGHSIDRDVECLESAWRRCSIEQSEALPWRRNDMLFGKSNRRTRRLAEDRVGPPQGG
jgi:hypothetical protein